jgi:hypothetical protein
MHLTLETVEAEDVWRYKAMSSGVGGREREAGKLGCLIKVFLRERSSSGIFRVEGKRRNRKI